MHDYDTRSHHSLIDSSLADGQLAARQFKYASLLYFMVTPRCQERNTHHTCDSLVFKIPRIYCGYSNWSFHRYLSLQTCAGLLYKAPY